jgi:serine protease Do
MNWIKNRMWRPVLATAAICAFAGSMTLAQMAPQVAPASPASAAPAAPPPAPAAPAAPQAAPAPRAVIAGDVYMFGQGSYLGVDLRDVTSDRVAPLKLNEERGAEVTMVDQDSPAGKSGLKEHDVILTFNGSKVESVEQLRRFIHELPPGRTVTLGVSREGKPVTVTAQLADRKALSKSYRATTPRTRIMIPPIPPIDFDIPNIEVVRINSTRTGMSVSSLTPQLGEYFGAPNGRGLLVSSVEKGSVAEAAGLKAGDVIVKVANDRISDTGDWRMALREHSGNVTVTIIRDKREQTVTLKLPERRETGQFHVEFPDEISLSMQPEFAEATRLAISDAGLAMEKAGREMERAMRQSQREVERELRQNKEKLKRQNEKLKQQLKQEMKQLEQDLQ